MRIQDDGITLHDMYVSAVPNSVWKQKKLTIVSKMSYRPANNCNVSYNEFVSKSVPPGRGGFTKQRKNIDRAVKHRKGLIDIMTILAIVQELD